MTVRIFKKFSYAKNLTALCVLLLLSACSSDDGGGGVVLVNGVTWTAPSARADGTILSLSEIDGYRVYYGVLEGDYPNKIEVNDPVAQQAELAGIAAGIYFVVVTTVDVDGRESEFSSPAVRVQI